MSVGHFGFHDFLTPPPSHLHDKCPQEERYRNGKVRPFIVNLKTYPPPSKKCPLRHCLPRNTKVISVGAVQKSFASVEKVFLLLNAAVCSTFFIYKGTKMKLGSTCRADRAQSSGPTIRSLANFYIELEQFCCSL